MTSLNYSELHFTSSEFDDGTVNRPEYRLVGGIIDRVRKIKVANVVVPVTYYIVNSNNNSFDFEEAAGGGVTTATLTAGNYTSTTFMTELKTQMEAVSSNTYTYTITLSDSTKKLTISTGANFEIDVASSKTLTGFSAATTAATSQTATDILNLSGPNQLYLRSNIATRIDTKAVVKNSALFNNVLTTVPINVNTFDVVFKSYNESQYFNSDIDIQDLEFYFTDDNDNIIDFNGGIFSLTIQLFREVTNS